MKPILIKHIICWHTRQPKRIFLSALSRADIALTQLNRAARYIPQTPSQAAGTPKHLTLERSMNRGRAKITSAAGSFGKAVGHEPFAEIMILALAMSHIVERPAMSMEGGPLVLWSGKPAAVWSVPEFIMVILQIRAAHERGFCRNGFHHENHFPSFQLGVCGVFL